MSIVEAVRTYLADCELIDELAPLSVDNVKLDGTNYSINPIPVDSLLKEYINGDSEMQFQFLFLTKANTDTDAQYISNQAFYQSLSEWFESQTDVGDLPDLDFDTTGKKSMELKALNSGYLSNVEEGGQSGIYQITCQLIYWQKGS